MTRRFFASVALAAAAVLVMTSTAFGHECFIANRSAQGNANVTHSDRWVTLSVAGFAHSPDFPPGVDPDCFIAYWSSHGTDDTTINISNGRAARDEFAKRNGCSTDDPQPIGNDGCVAYQGCDEGYPVNWCEFEGIHEPPPFSGPEIWGFLSQF